MTTRRKERGIALIMVAGVLSVLAAMATGFLVLMIMGTNSAVRYSDSVRAYAVGQAGIQFGIAQMRSNVYRKTEDAGSAWYMYDWMYGGKKGISFPDSDLLHNGTDDDGDGVVDNPEEALVSATGPARLPAKSYSAALGNSANASLISEGPSDRFALNVSDAASKVNINAGDNLGVILDNLCRVIGPPLVAADLDALQPRRWAVAGSDDGDVVKMYANTKNLRDNISGFSKAVNLDIYYSLADEGNTITTDGTGRPIRDAANKTALFGDGYAIAGYRARNGAFQNIEDIKNALTYVERNGNSTPDDPLEQLEIEVKFAAIRDYLTINSWVDTNTVCTGKFEWVYYDSGEGKTYAIDRDKSWVQDMPATDPNKPDPLNRRGSLRGCYLAIVNGHGAGQVRRIRSNGIDWIEVEPPDQSNPKGPAFTVTPGPTSSYMIIANEPAMLQDVNGKALTYTYPDNMPPIGMKTFPQTDASDGSFKNNPKIDYSLYPLCIHRAPVNVNTASDKVLVALLLGLNVMHGHPLSLGTDTNVELVRRKWKATDPFGVQPYTLTPAGMKRLPATSGKMVLNRQWGGSKQMVPPPTGYDVAYLNNYNTLGAPNFAYQGNVKGTMTEAHELAYRIIMARQMDRLSPPRKYIDPETGAPTTTNTKILRGPFRSWDDFYFRAIKPFDDMRVKNGWTDSNGDGYQNAGDTYKNARLAPMLMAHFNPNTDILKFNPNIEWIDRWGRNFTDQEPIMVYTNERPSAGGVKPFAGYNDRYSGVFDREVAAADPITSQSIPLYTCVIDSQAKGWGGACPPIESSLRVPRQMSAVDVGLPIPGAYITRNFRYKSDEMIDKTDMNRSTTEFSFDSNGVFEIVSSGQIIKNHKVLSERKFYALVKLYDVWRESTQQQFVNGTISKAIGDRGSTFSGQLARDGSGLVERKGLVTLPEPLLPLKAKIVDQDGNTASNSKNRVGAVPNKEVVSNLGGTSDPLDAYGNPRKNPYDRTAASIDVPDVLANQILPARYDGQIVLATNTSSYDPNVNGDCDSFLASFDGDLDTATCQGNGREQAKWPSAVKYDPYSGTSTYTGEGYKHRCVHTISLLGLLNDTLIANDPGLPLIDGTAYTNWATDQTKIRWVYPFYGISSALMPLKVGAGVNDPYYWNNVTLRQGDLRMDGAYLSAPGVSGNNATLKYLYTPTANRQKQSDGRSPVKLNFQPDSKNGTCVSMWAKTTWHQDDNRNHEFFNPSNMQQVRWCGGYLLQKMGQYKWTSVQDNTSVGGLDLCGNRHELNDLFALVGHDMGPNYRGNPWIYGTFLHGGFAYIDAETSSNEAPSFRVQPFRWSFLGYRANYGTAKDDPEGQGPRGHSINKAGNDASITPAQPPSVPGWQNQKNITISKYYVRPFIDTSVYQENEANWSSSVPNGAHLMWTYRTFSLIRTPNKSALIYSTVGNPRDAESNKTSATYPDPTDPNDWREGQDVKWIWADPAPKSSMANYKGYISPDPYQSDISLKSFGVNNLNYGNSQWNTPVAQTQEFKDNGSAGLYWHYRHMPEDGTYAVIDEFKISNRDRVMTDTGSDWKKDRIVREMKTSRYYLPPNATSRGDPLSGGPPTFTSQTLLHSLKGYDNPSDTQKVSLVRVSWTVFTPRFMCEYQEPTGDFKRTEKFTDLPKNQQALTYAFKGPFDYLKYNDDGDISFSSVNRPAPWLYPSGQSQASKGVEIELLEDQGGSPKVLGGKTFTDPAALNVVGTPENPTIVMARKLRYRVRFVYPVDPLVDPNGGSNGTYGKAIDRTRQYLLDTPVFDDISVTYMIPQRILTYREIAE